MGHDNPAIQLAVKACPENKVEVRMGLAVLHWQKRDCCQGGNTQQTQY